MGLAAAKCTQCGASIKVDESKEAGICIHCGTAFITEKVINNYNTYITQNITQEITQNITTTVYEKETMLWNGESSKLGGAMFAAKIILLIVVLFEAALVFIAAFADIGLGGKWKTFGVLQACLIMPAIIFPVIYFQILNFKYSVTNERISFIFGMSDNNFIDYKDIIDIKIKYAFYERNKKFGTIKIKLRDRRFRPLRNHLRSIKDPEKVYDIIKNCISQRTQ